VKINVNKNFHSLPLDISISCSLFLLFELRLLLYFILLFDLKKLYNVSINMISDYVRICMCVYVGLHVRTITYSLQTVFS